MALTIVNVGNAKITWASKRSKGATILEGIKGIRIGGVKLMDESFPSVFVFQGPDGWDYRRFELIALEQAGESVVVRTKAIGTVADASWTRDQYDYDIQYVGNPRQVPPLEVDFVFTPAAETFRETQFAGFRLDFRFRMTGGKLARLQWRQHWEIGGHATGSTVYSQSQIASPVHEFTLESTWNNVCWKTLFRGPTDDNVSMQFNARCAYHQLFDFLRAGRGIFLGYFEQARAIQTICQKNAGEDNYHIQENMDFRLASEGELTGKTILFAPKAGRTEAQTRNIWFDVNEYMNDSYREQAGIRRSRLLPTDHFWGWRTLPIDGHLYFGEPENPIPAEKYLEHLAETYVPRVYEKGIRRFWFRPYATNDTTELMFWCKADRGRGILDGGVQFSSCCTVWEYKPSKMFGGGEAARRFYELGHKAGVEIGMWVGNHISTKAPILADHPEWVLKDRNAANPAGGYDDLTMAIVDWNSGARDWILQDVLDWKKNYGLDFIFFDSFGNLGLKCRNYAREDLADNFDGAMKFLAAVTQAGIDVMPEGLSFVGVPFMGLDNSGVMQSESDPLVGQNSLGWFVGNEDMLTGCHPFTEWNPNVDPQRFWTMQFKAIANKAVLSIQKQVPDEAAANFRIYNQVEPYMQRRTLLERDLGVLWDSGDGKGVFFAYRKGTLKLPAAGPVSQVKPDGLDPLGTKERIVAGPQEVYLIG